MVIVNMKCCAVVFMGKRETIVATYVPVAGLYGCEVLEIIVHYLVFIVLEIYWICNIIVYD